MERKRGYEECYNYGYLWKSEAVHAAERAGAGWTVFYCRGRFHLIRTILEKRINPAATIIYRTATGYKTFRYVERDFPWDEEITIRVEKVGASGLLMERWFEYKTKRKKPKQG